MIRLRNPEYLGSLSPAQAAPEPNLVLWMDFTGADEGTTFVDRSVSASVVTPHGSAKTDNAKYKSSPTSAYFLKSTKSYLSIPTGTWSNLALLDFTIELWVYPDGAYTESADVFGKTALNSFGPWRIAQESNNWRWYAISAGGTDWVPAAGGMGGSFDPFSLGSINLNTWQHLAISRQGTSWKFFKDGSEINSAASRSLNLWNNSDDACVGRLTYSVDNYYFQGWVDDLKVYKGRAARWANFTP